MATQNKPLLITFNRGIQSPAKLGTPTTGVMAIPMLKPATESRMSYAQNIDLSNDLYGDGVVTPGPFIEAIVDTSGFVGRARSLRSVVGIASGTGLLTYLYFVQGDNTIRRLSLIPTSAPVLDTLALVATHGAHTNPIIDDIQLRQVAGSALPVVYIALRDDTDGVILKFTGDLASPTVTDIATSADVDGKSGFKGNLTLGADGNMYWGYANKISAIDVADAFTVNKLAGGLPGGYGVTALLDWQAQLIIAYSTNSPYDFGRRHGSGKAGIIIWDYTSPTFIRNVPAPCRYISAMVNDPSGNLLVFGGIDSGRSAVYIFTGYGFRLLTSYIGDMPESRHSVDFDSEGRVIWLNTFGQLCRYDQKIDRFEWWASLPPILDSFVPGLGGMLTRGYQMTQAAGGQRFDYFASSDGTISSSPIRIIKTDTFIADTTPTVETSSTPKAVSGLQTLPNHSTITAVTINLARNLQLNERVIFQVYVNGDTTPAVYDNLDFAIDGAINSKRKSLTLNNVNNFAVGLVFKGISQSPTAPAVLNCVVEYT